jgi:tetratricopeptide (TPR) repeat protein
LNGEFENGIAALKEKDYEKAREVFSAIIEQKPENADAHLGLSFAYAALDNIADAEKHLMASFGLFEAQRKFSEAYVTAETLLEMKPKVVKYTFDLLRVYLKLNFMKSFSELLVATMESEEISEDVFSENMSSLAHFIQNAEIKEILSLKKAGVKEEEKLNPFENLELANLLFEIGSTDEAKTEYYKTARAFLNRDLKDKAQELFVRIKELYPDDAELSSLKDEIDRFGQQEETIDLEERKSRLIEVASRLGNENEARVRYSIASILKEFAQYEQAEEQLEILFQLGKTPEKIKAHVLLSQMFLDSQDSTAAEKTLEEVIGSGEFEEGELVPIKYKLGALYERSGKYEKAQDMFEQAYEADSEYLDIVDRVKNVKELIKKREEEAAKEAEIKAAKEEEERKAAEEAEREAERAAVVEAEREVEEEKEAVKVSAEADEVPKSEEEKREVKEAKKKKTEEVIVVEEDEFTVQERILYI